MRRATKLRPRTKPPAERREELMNAAQHLFLASGVATTTIEEITSRAGVAKGTFYLYFSSKDDVLAALGDRFARELLAKIKRAVAGKRDEDWRAKLANWASAGVGGYLDSMRLHDVIFLGSRPHSREGLVNNILVDHLRELLQAGVRAGAWSIDDPRATAVFLFNGLHGVVDYAHAFGKSGTRSEFARKAERLFLRTVGAMPAGNKS
jgi:AcrR family transcriptional regulator